MTTAPTLAIVLVSYNAREDLFRCLASLHSHPPAASHEIILVDNASTDEGLGVVRDRWPRVRIIENAENLGFARANNIGIRASTSELILLLNTDTIVPAGAIDQLIAALRAHPDAAVAGPRLVDGAGQPELSFGRMMGPLNELRQKLLVRGHARGWPIVSARVDRLTRQPRLTDWVSGACLLVRRGDAEPAGLLDERYFMYCEDVDFCAAIRARGRAILFTPDAEVIHLRGRSGADAPGATQAAYRRAHLAFYEKHHPRWAPVLRWYLAARGIKTA